ncbi:hypothetical protein thalar_01114 [Litoreibacter arenae DSM 19593]|uniref:Uncharacterized protein n=1 Tax=Litoreibacter arenae DSM 19593 TaxID=1123360 RepID=S9QMA7_9RHOB|nr:hypothetical protein thalar_01114 [Litoreibacter arenae DSM 19593]
MAGDGFVRAKNNGSPGYSEANTKMVKRTRSGASLLTQVFAENLPNTEPTRCRKM